MDRRERNHKWYTSFSEKGMVFTLENGEGEEITIPAIFEVCETCEGRGKHVNPSIDSNGLSEEDFDMDPDFRENYFSGLYDVACNECRGNRVSPVVNWDALTPELKKYVEEYIDDFHSYEAMCAMERRMGC